MRKHLLILLLILYTTPMALGNNVRISNVEVVRIDRTAKIMYIKFDLSGENAWRLRGGVANWDANWVFIKYRSGTGNWDHATLRTNKADYLYPAEITINPSGDGKGAFIYLANSDAGFVSNYNYQNIVFAWDYGADNFNDASTDLEIKVFAIEMVYIPQGNFYLGDGHSYGTFHNSSNNPAFISTNPVTVYCDNTSYDDAQLKTNGVLIDGDEGIDTDNDLNIDNTNFPTGYQAFYCMKYEVSQQQYVDFLNNITAAEANARWAVHNSARNNVSDPANYPNISTTSPYVAMNWIDWHDLAAYLDWAALRPMTELEYEKASRGTANPVAGDFPWGTSNMASNTYSLQNADAADETVTNPSSTAGNLNISVTVPGNNLEGPMRCGIFAANNTTNSKEFAGSSFYGVMELAGNVWEMTVTLGKPDGRAFMGSHGDGQLVNNNADNPDWPNTSGSDLGVGYRGGSYHDYAYTVSNRYYAAFGYYPRDFSQGGRGVRTAD